MKPSQWEAIGSVEYSIVVSLILVGYSKFKMRIVLYVFFHCIKLASTFRQKQSRKKNETCFESPFDLTKERVDTF